MLSGANEEQGSYCAKPDVRRPVSPQFTALGSFCSVKLYLNIASVPSDNILSQMHTSLNPNRTVGNSSGDD